MKAYVVLKDKYVNVSRQRIGIRVPFSKVVTGFLAFLLLYVVILWFQDIIFVIVF